jgi:hypothetical protein
MDLEHYIHRLERFSRHCGVPVARRSLQADVAGRVEERRIVLRAGLRPEQQLLTLVHELTHLLVHCNARPAINRTVCEYEAEAVERWVGTALRVAPYGDAALDVDAVTEGLLACSVRRVRWASLLLINTARGALPQSQWSRLQAQSAVEVDAASGEEVIFNNKLRGVRDFIRLAQPL